MYLFTKPSHERISEFIQSQARLEFTYRSVGATREGDRSAGFVVDHNRIQLGAGQATFDAARRALCEWQHYRFPYVRRKQGQFARDSMQAMKAAVTEVSVVPSAGERC